MSTGDRQIDDIRRAVVLVGHGSLQPGAGAAMVHLAERACDAGLAPIVRAGYLNYSQPAFAEVLEQCVDEGATEVVVQPYFLIPGKYVRQDLAQLLEAARSRYPRLDLWLAQPFGDHPALAQLLLKRASATSGIASPPQRSGLLIMAHGSPDPRSNMPIYSIARQLRASGRYDAVLVCFLDLNRPSIPDAIDLLAARGLRQIIAAPLFLQLGNHVRQDLPAIVEAARARHPGHQIVLAEHLGHDELLLEVITDRVEEAAQRLEIAD
jgi:sirohydrochlorin ferrochelatase